jgi:hypothetical protein
MHITSHTFKVKQLDIVFLKVLYTPGFALLKVKISIHSARLSPSSAATASFSYEKTFCDDGVTCDDMRVL